MRDNAEQKILNRLEALRALKKKRPHLIVGVVGCMAERVKDELIERHGVNLVAGPDAYLSLPDLMAAAEAGEKAINVELSTTETYRDVVPRHIGAARISGFVSIMRGCNNFCTYCIVPYTRGRERSRDVESRGKRFAGTWFCGGHAFGAECQFLSVHTGGRYGHHLPRIVAYRGPRRA